MKRHYSPNHPSVQYQRMTQRDAYFTPYTARERRDAVLARHGLPPRTPMVKTRFIIGLAFLIASFYAVEVSFILALACTVSWFVSWRTIYMNWLDKQGI